MLNAMDRIQHHVLPVPSVQAFQFTRWHDTRLLSLVRHSGGFLNPQSHFWGVQGKKTGGVLLHKWKSLHGSFANGTGYTNPALRLCGTCAETQNTHFRMGGMPCLFY